MDLQGFDERGFLSPGISRSTLEIRANNAEWFKLAEDLNGALIRAATSGTAAVRTESMSATAVAVRLALRSTGLMAGVIIMAERGMTAEARLLARGLLESAFCVGALIYKPTVFLKMLKDDHQRSRKNQARFLVAQNLASDPRSKAKLETTIAAIDKKAEIMSPKKVAELGPLIKQYLTYQRLSDDAAHVTAKSLHRHVHVRGGRWMFNWGPADAGENAATLYHAALAAISIGVGITEMLDNREGNAEFAGLSARFQAMPSVPIV